MQTFVPKPPFDLTSFLSKPGKPRVSRYSGHRPAAAMPPPETDVVTRPFGEAPHADGKAKS